MAQIIGAQLIKHHLAEIGALQTERHIRITQQRILRQPFKVLSLDKRFNRIIIAACDGKVLSYDNRHDNLLDHPPLSSAQLELAHPIVGHGNGEANDAMVLVSSAKWGQFNGCIPADHMDEVGQRIGSGSPALWSRFDHIRFYRDIAYGLDEAAASVSR